MAVTSAATLGRKRLEADHHHALIIIIAVLTVNNSTRDVCSMVLFRSVYCSIALVTDSCCKTTWAQRLALGCLIHVGACPGTCLSPQGQSGHASA